jgi:transcription elongation factor Elf1
MKIATYESMGGRDFKADMECEHCGHAQKIRTGYDDSYYHNNVIPAMTCGGCGKNRAGNIPEVKNDSGMVSV